MKQFKMVQETLKRLISRFPNETKHFSVSKPKLCKASCSARIHSDLKEKGMNWEHFPGQSPTTGYLQGSHLQKKLETEVMQFLLYKYTSKVNNSYGQLQHQDHTAVPELLPSLAINKLLFHLLLMSFECSRSQSNYQK